MDRDSIKEILEKRYEELSREEVLPKLEKRKVETSVVETKPKKSLTLPILIILIVFGALLYFGIQVYDRWKVAQFDQNEVLLERLSKLTDIPELEVPTIATVTNANMVRNQLFFKEALNRDKVVIYKESKKAILYRPSTDKIISVAPIN